MTYFNSIPHSDFNEICHKMVFLVDKQNKTKNSANLNWTEARSKSKSIILI